MIASFTALLLGLVASSLVMIVAMVGFLGAVIARDPRSASRWRWFWVYFASWVAIMYVVARMPAEGEGRLPLGVLVFIPTLWATFNAFWLRACFALGGANDRDSHERQLPPDADVLSRRAARLFEIGMALMLIAAWDLGWLQQMFAAMFQPGRRAAALFISVSVIGFALFMTGAVRLALGTGREMSRDHIEEQHRASTFGPKRRIDLAGYRWSKWKTYGSAHGRSVDLEFKVADLRDAWRSGLWRRDPQLQTAFLMLSGVVAAVVGGFGSAVVLGSPTTRFVIGGFISYGLLMAWLGRRRGRRERSNGSV